MARNDLPKGKGPDNQNKLYIPLNKKESIITIKEYSVLLQNSWFRPIVASLHVCMKLEFTKALSTMKEKVFSYTEK